MKRIAPFSVRFLFAVVAAALMATGCSTTESSTKTGEPKRKLRPIAESSLPLPDGVVLREEKDLQGVWLAEGFNFTGKPRLVIEPTVFKGKVRENEAAMRAFAVSELRDSIAKAARQTGLFSEVVSTDNAPATSATNAVTYRLVNTITEFEKGGGGARYFAGLYGAGQPVIRVHGRLMDTNNAPVFIFEADRSGERASARVFGAFDSDEHIQRDDIWDLSIDLADYMMRTAGLTPPKR